MKEGRFHWEWACSIAWIMHRPPKPGTAGSNPAAPATITSRVRASSQRWQFDVGISQSESEDTWISVVLHRILTMHPESHPLVTGGRLASFR